MRKSESPIHVKYLQTMVECLCMLGKVAAAGAIMWYVMLLFFLCCIFKGRHLFLFLFFFPIYLQPKIKTYNS